MNGQGLLASLTRIGLAVLAVYLAYVALLFLMQRSVLFPGTRRPAPPWPRRADC